MKSFSQFMKLESCPNLLWQVRTVKILNCFQTREHHCFLTTQTACRYCHHLYFYFNVIGTELGAFSVWMVSFVVLGVSSPPSPSLVLVFKYLNWHLNDLVWLSATFHSKPTHSLTFQKDILLTCFQGFCENPILWRQAQNGWTKKHLC